MPERCPVCDTPVVQDEGAVRVYCPNPRCPARLAQEYGHFVGRGGMDIEGAGWAVLSQLLERGMIHSRADIFRLTVEDFESLERFARKSAENLPDASSERASAGRSRACSTASGMPQVGEQTAIDLAGWLRRGSGRRVPPPTARSCRILVRGGRGRTPAAATDEPEDITEVSGIGGSVATAVGRWFTDDGHARRPARTRRRRDRARTPRCGRPGRRRRPAGPARRSSSPARSRGSAARRPRRRSAPPAASPAVRLEEDGLPRRRRERRLEAREGPGTRRARPRRGRVPAAAGRRVADETHPVRTHDRPRTRSRAAAYQAVVAGALGDDDPAEAQATTPATIRALIAEAGGGPADTARTRGVVGPRLHRPHRGCGARDGRSISLGPRPR